MDAKYFSLHFFLLSTILMTTRTLGEPSGYAMVDDYDDGGGEICDPNKSNACESPTAECVWKPLDMLYKCTEPRNYSKKRLSKRKKKSDDRRNGTRKRMVKGFSRPDSNSNHRGDMDSLDMIKVNPFHKGGKFYQKDGNPLDTNSESSEDIIIGAAIQNDETTSDRYSDLNPTTENQLQGGVNQSTLSTEISQPVTEIHEVATQSLHSSQEPYHARGRLAPGAPNPKATVTKKKPEGTLEIPKYYGEMTWDGQTVFSDTCIVKSVMAEALQERKSLESKKQWVEDNKEQICNFRKFFHCTIEQADKELVLEDGDEEELPTDPVCRCYESAMPVVKGKCYIPADFGAKSACGDHVTAPYPIQPWRGAPTLKPRCTPNSDCKESQYWFGKRCTCRYNARWNPQTHTCDKGTKLVVSLGLLLASYAIIVLNT